jgi:tRNA threonylcarbamoyladenosine biosynthesis protein TsaB
MLWPNRKVNKDMTMILAIDTSTAACTIALFDSAGSCLAHRDELIGRGHAERLVPMIEELLDGRSATHILVGVGPGSFTGIRVGIAAAQGLAIGWDAQLAGMSSLALLAASAPDEASVAAAMHGGHGELFVQQFEALAPSTPLLTLAPDGAAALISAKLVVGPAAADLVDTRGSGEAVEAWPRAADALKLPEELRTLAPRPIYARAPDARAREAA